MGSFFALDFTGGLAAGRRGRMTGNNPDDMYMPERY
jgi:hypothetical protein